MRTAGTHENVLLDSDQFQSPLDVPAKSDLAPRRRASAPANVNAVEEMMRERNITLKMADDGRLELRQADVDKLVSEGVLPAFKASAAIYCPVDVAAMSCSISFTRDGHSYTLSGRKLETLRKAAVAMQDPNGLVAFELADRPLVKLNRRDLTSLCQALSANAKSVAGSKSMPPPSAPVPPPQLISSASFSPPPKMLYKPGRKAHVGESLVPLAGASPPPIRTDDPFVSAPISPPPLPGVIARRASAELQTVDPTAVIPSRDLTAISAVRKLKIKDVKKQLAERGIELSAKASKEECYSALEAAVAMDLEPPRQNRLVSERHEDSTNDGPPARWQMAPPPVPMAPSKPMPEPAAKPSQRYGSEWMGSERCESDSGADRFQSERGARSILGARFGRRRSERFEEEDEVRIDPTTGLPEEPEVAEHRKARQAVISEVWALNFSDVKAKLYARGISAIGKREVLYGRLEEDELKKFDAENPRPIPKVKGPAKPLKGRIFKVVLQKPDEQAKLGMVLEGVGEVRIESLKPGGIAALSGDLHVGLIVMAIDGVPVKNHTHAASMLKGLHMELTIRDEDDPGSRSSSNSPSPSVARRLVNGVQNTMSRFTEQSPLASRRAISQR